LGIERDTKDEKNLRDIGESERKESFVFLVLLVTLRRGSSVSDSLLTPLGGYQNLLFYQKSEIVYDATVKFVFGR